jgi:hypothetical protein
MYKRYKLDPVVRKILAEVLVGLAVNWISIAFLVPPFSEKGLEFNLFVLISDIMLAILSLVFSYKLRKEN